MITATGKRDGKELEVVITNKRNILFNDVEDVYLELIFKRLLDERHHMGVYYPERNSVLNYINVLENYFFDSTTTARTDEKVEQMEFEKGVVY